MTVAVAAALLVLFQTVPAWAVDGYQEAVPGTPPNTGAGCGETWTFGIQSFSGPGFSTWGEMCFVADGDYFWLHDTRGDSHSIGIQWKILGTTRSGLIRDKLGVGENAVLNKDFPENSTVKFRLGKCQVTSTVDCHSASDYVDWAKEAEDGRRFWLCVNTSNSSDMTFC